MRQPLRCAADEYLLTIDLAPMLLHRTATIIALLLFPLAAAAQTGEVRGTVVDAETGEVLPGVNVALEGTTLGTASESDGSYALTSLLAGRDTRVAAAHREAAFAACEFTMDYLKTRAPFWKREAGPDGGRWVEARETAPKRADRWKEQVR